MRDWLTPTDIAKAKLPELPASRRGVDFYIARSGWDARLEKWRHGKKGVEYHISLLTEAAQATLAARAIGSLALPNALLAQAEAAPDAKTLTVPALENRNARLALIAAANRFAKEAQLAPTLADQRFAALYNLEK